MAGRRQLGSQIIISWGNMKSEYDFSEVKLAKDASYLANFNPALWGKGGP